MAGSCLRRKQTIWLRPGRGRPDCEQAGLLSGQRMRASRAFCPARGGHVMDNRRGGIRSGTTLTAAFAASVLAASVLAGPACGQGAVPDISGVYWATQYNAKVQIVGGGDLPLTAQGKAAYEKNMAGL